MDDSGLENNISPFPQCTLLHLALCGMLQVTDIVLRLGTAENRCMTANISGFEVAGFAAVSAYKAGTDLFSKY
jgi:hypothetical protein